MSKRKRPAGPEDSSADTTAAFSGSHSSHNADTIAASHDSSTIVDMAPPGPYSYTREKRQQTSSQNRPNNNGNNGQHAKHPFFGQASALPQVETNSDGEEDEAMAYLRSVKAEAEGLASVVTAHPQDIPYDEQLYDPEYDYDDYEEDDQDQDEGEEDTAGWYEDGAYIGAPTAVQPMTVRPTAQSLYYDALSARFLTLRSRLHIEPSAESIASLSSTQPITVPHRSNELAHRTWRYNLRSTEPAPLQLRAMKSPTVLQLLSMIDGQLEASVNEAKNISGTTSRWIWGLLARLEDVGQLNTNQVANVRDLAKTAVWLGYKYRKMGVEKVSGESELEAAKARILGKLDEAGRKEEVPDANTLATLDLIITVAGEFYGQRDLLQSRLPWDKVE